MNIDPAGSRKKDCRSLDSVHGNPDAAHHNGRTVVIITACAWNFNERKIDTMTKIENIPAYLREHGLFNVWRYETDQKGRRTKMPYNPNNPQCRGDSTDRSTFAPLNTAAARANGFDGIGIGIFDSVAAIDIDHCMKDGKLSAMAADIVETMDAYTEISPSGEGLRILFLAPGFRYDDNEYYINNQKSGLEIYLPEMTKKYVTVTGNTLRSRDMLDRADRLQTILDKYMKRPQQPTQTAAPMPGTPADISDRELLDKAMNARNGGQFKSLWEGSIMNYPSQSEADLALCNLLAFWTGKDAARMEALFRQSGLCRESGGKYKSPAHYTKYLQKTIAKAITSCVDVYTPPQERPQAPQTGGKPADDKNPAPEQKTPQEAPQPRKTAMQLFNEFMGKVQTEAYKPLETGMPAFDRLLGGGILRQSLVILTAAPGTGKTALASQVFEEMAKQGADVIFLNLEMSREQLFARSVSRICYKQGHKGISAADVLKGYSWDGTRRGFIQDAADEYRRTIAERMQYNPEGTGTTLDSIMNVLNAAGEAAKQADKPAPVCVLDYLHLITTDKREEQAEILKKAVAALKGYAIRYDTFVFAISANNRAANASGIVSLDSGRDTSAIEYSADYQLSLNYAALANRRKKDNGEYYKTSNPDDMAELQRGDANGNREMIVQVLKNRLNAPGGKLYLSFNPAASVFYPVDKYATPPAYYKGGGFTPIDDEDPDNPFI